MAMLKVNEADVDGVSISYSVYGTGLPILLLHGFGETSAIWHRQLAVLSAHNQLIVPDLPGATLLDAPDQTTLAMAAHLPTMAAAVTTLAQRIATDRLLVLGHSMGGYLALEMCHQQPKAFRGLGLIHSTAYADTAEKKQARLKGIETLLTHGSHAFLRVSIPGLFSHTFQQQHPEVVAELVEASRKFSPAVLAAYYKAMRERPHRSDVLSDLGAPVLFVAGSHDVAVPLEDVLAQAALPQVAHLHVLQQIGHMGMLEATDALNAALKLFIMDC
jgi:pimeloyl-ACP methyl ester carboxylesterase